MDLQLLIAIAVFSFVTSVTPGPNNTILLATGVNHGFAKAVPFILGIQTGIVIVLSALSLGLSVLLGANPIIMQWLKYIGFAYIIYLAYRIAVSREVQGGAVAKPFGYFKAVSLQFVNPKVWITMTAFTASFIPANASIWLYALIFAWVAIIKIPGASLWAAFGQLLRELLQKPKQILTFNFVAAVSLVGSMVPVVFFS
jgi:threonine/homoserine/homoserine lactone efflux protein